MKKRDRILCSIHNWARIFEDITIESIVLPIPSDALQYFLDDGPLVIPKDPHVTETEQENSEDDESQNSDVLPLANLDEFSNEISKAISRLGGKVFPKLNWSSPKDASWIMCNKSLQCIHPSDVYLLLKSSDFIARDLTSPFKDCEDVEDQEEKLDYNLVLRKWVEINPSQEFRCFVKDGQFIGISQREISQFHSYISREKDAILNDLSAFWNENIKSEFPLSSYSFDIFRPKNGEVVLVDFGPYGHCTDGLLFTWDELLEKNTNMPEDVKNESNQQPEFRYIGEAIGVQPSPYMRYGLPWDVVGLSGRDISNLSDFIQNKMNFDENGFNEQNDKSSNNPSDISGLR